jgi:diguanylate cyclase (GGDEF)-like protein/PAS domain S-box-containing protein
VASRSLVNPMSVLGEIIRWLEISLQALHASVGRRYRRLVARLLRRDELVAGSERKFHALLESAPDAMVIVDWHGHIQLANAQFETLFGWTSREIVGQNVGELIPEQFRAAHREHLKSYIRTAASRPMGRDLELLACRQDGGTFPVEISLGPLQTDGGLLVSAAIRDITTRKRAEAALREAEERFRTAFEEAPVGMALARLDGRLLQVNRALCEITGHSREQLEAATFASITHPDDAGRDQKELQRLIDGETSQYRAERRYLHASGDPVPVDLSVAVVRDAAGAAHHFLAQVHDITERKRFEGQLQYLADHDALTGMFNRRRFEDELEREMANAARYDTGGAVLAVDLDYLKYINDTLGHSVGDELITRVSAIFRTRLRTTDIIARIGGDEFAVILPRANEHEATLIAGKLLSAVRDEARLEVIADGPKRVTASIGIALFGAASRTCEEVLVEADIAMYDAKEAGRDRVEVYDLTQNGREKMHAGMTWVDRIRDALEEDRFVLHAQPIIALNGDPVPRYELLIRMIGENDDVIPPSTFLSIAERFGLIQLIDRWVVHSAIELLAVQKRAGRSIQLALNLSAKSVTDPELPGFVSGELEAAGINGEGLCIEVTETAAIVNVDRARGFAHTLAELGCEFALDDFGAGFASFYYLKHMAFDYVKIDGEFIRNLPESRVNQLVVKAVVDIARGLGKRTIAEFVGDEETVSLLKRYGVDYAQGFYVGKPQPLDVFGLVEPIAVPAS